METGRSGRATRRRRARNLLREMGDRPVGHLHTRITELAERTALAA